MALVASNILTAISGKIGGVEFAQIGSRTIAKTQKKRKTLLTWRTIEAQRVHAYKISIWKAMTTDTPENIRAWNLYAASHPLRNRLSQQRTLSGFQYFMLHFIPDQNMGGTTMCAPTSFPRTSSPLTFSAAITAPYAFTVTSTFNYPVFSMLQKVVSYSDPCSASPNPQTLRYHRLAANTIGLPDSAPYSYADLCARREIAFVPGQHITVRLIAIHQLRQPSPPSYYTLTIAAP